jgi:hypothetical protein
MFPPRPISISGNKPFHNSVVSVPVLVRLDNNDADNILDGKEKSLWFYSIFAFQLSIW